MKRTLMAATYLGDNTIGPLGAIVAAIRDRGLDIEIVHLDSRTSEHAEANAAGLDLVWICGALFEDLAGRSQLGHQVVAAPVFTGRTEPLYHSVIIAHRDGPNTMAQALGGRVAINELVSWSGSRALRHHVEPRWFGDQLITGSHAASIRAVAARHADCAAVDNTIWQAWAGRDPAPAELGKLAVIDRTRDWPAPPLVLNPGLDQGSKATMVQAILGVGPVEGIARFVAASGAAYRVMGAADRPTSGGT